VAFAGLLATGCAPQVNLGGEQQTLGGQLRGLTPGEAITLQDSLGETLTLSSNGAFSFPTPVPSGAMYSVTILTNPTSPVDQTCSVSNGSGMAGDLPIANITVDCDLLAYFPFQGNADDASGYGHDAVVVSASLSSDRYGNPNSAYAFAGVGSIQAVMPTGFLPSGSAERTVVAWLEPTQSTRILGLVYWGAENCTGNVFGLGDLGEKVTFWGGCNDFTSSLMVPVGSWSFLAAVYTPAVPTQITLYVGNDVGTGPILAPTTQGVGNLVIGADLVNGGPALTGKIDSIRIYGHALNAAEIQSIFNSSEP
jgi:hypothetical protein